jgi:hypothetical protein
VEYFREQESNVERLNRICRKTWETLDYVKNKILSQIQHRPSNELGWNKICLKIMAVNRSLAKCIDDMDEKYQNEINTMLNAMENVIIDNTKEFDSDPNQAELLDRENRILEGIEFYYQRMFGILINGQVNGATSGCTEAIFNASIELINFIEDVRYGVDVRIAFRFIAIEEVRKQELIKMIKEGVQNKDTMEAILKCFSMINGCVRHREDISLYRDETQKRAIGFQSLELH